MNDALCHGHHVWTTRGRYSECTRCGFTDLAAAAPRRPRPTIEQLLDFAAAHTGPFNGTVDEAIRTDLGITPARYFQLLRRAIRTREALEHDPQTTSRLLRQADQQARTRAARAGHL